MPVLHVSTITGQALLGWPSASAITFYSAVLHAVTLLSVMAYLLTVVTVMYASPKTMGVYKYMLLHELTLTFLFDAHLASLYQPVPLFAYQCGFSVGYMRRAYAENGNDMMKLTCLLMLGKFYCILVALAYRCSKTFPPWHWMAKVFEGKSVAFGVSLYALFGVTAAALLIPFSMVEVSQTRIKGDIAATDPVAGMLLSAEASSYCYSMDSTYGADATLMILSFILFGCFGIVLFVGFGMVSVRNIRKLRYNMNPSAYKHHRMMLVSCLSQAVLAVAFVAIPSLASITLIIIGLSQANLYVMGAVVFAGLHSLADYFAVVASIKPYRHFIAACLTGEKSLRSHSIGSVSIDVTQKVESRIDRVPTRRHTYTVAGLVRQDH